MAQYRNVGKVSHFEETGIRITMIIISTNFGNVCNQNHAVEEKKKTSTSFYHIIRYNDERIIHDNMLTLLFWLAGKKVTHTILLSGKNLNDAVV